MLRCRSTGSSISRRRWRFHYYRTGDVRVSSIYPMGGPRAGGTTVTVRGTGFRDLDHGNGLYCSFGTGGPSCPRLLRRAAPGTPLLVGS